MGTQGGRGPRRAWGGTELRTAWEILEIKPESRLPSTAWVRPRSVAKSAWPPVAAAMNCRSSMSGTAPKLQFQSRPAWPVWMKEHGISWRLSTSST